MAPNIRKFSRVGLGRKILLFFLVLQLFPMILFTSSSPNENDNPFFSTYSEKKDFSSPPSMNWKKTFIDQAYVQAYSVTETKDEELVICGNAWLIKTTSSGKLIWERQYGGDMNKDTFSVIQTTDGGFMFSGYITPTQSEVKVDAWLVKTDSSGEVEWSHTYGSYNDDVANKIIQTSDGGYILAGWTSSYGGLVDGWLIKVDQEGNPEWNKTYGGSNWDEIHSLIQIEDNGYLFVGETYEHFESIHSDLWVGKTDSFGNLNWTHLYGNSWNDRGRDIIKVNDEEYVITGETLLDDLDMGMDYWLLKIDAQGKHLWNRTFGGPKLDKAYSVIQTNDHGFVLAGKTFSFGNGSFDFWLVRTDSQGNHQWNQTYGGPTSDQCFDLIETSDGGLVMVGSIKELDVYQNDFLVIKVGGKLFSPKDEDSPVFYLLLGMILITVLLFGYVFRTR